MDSRESRIIILGMVVGAAMGGLTIMLMRLRGSRSEQESVKQAVSNMSWAEVMSIAIAAISLARRISALSEPVAETATKS